MNRTLLSAPSALLGSLTLTALSLAFSASAQAISIVNWGSGTSGTFGAGGPASGTTVTLTNVLSPALTPSPVDLSTANFSPPLGPQIMARYQGNSSWTASFSSPVSGLWLYASLWKRGTYIFNQPVAIRSGFASNGANLSGNTLNLPVDINYNGVLEFLAPVSSFTVTSSSTNTLATTRITFAAPVPFESDALPVVGATLFMAGGLWWKKKRAQAKVDEFVTKR